MQTEYEFKLFDKDIYSSIKFQDSISKVVFFNQSGLVCYKSDHFSVVKKQNFTFFILDIFLKKFYYISFMVVYDSNR